MADQIILQESVAGGSAISGNRWRAKIIAADTWGSTAYYPAEVLERDGSRVFIEGLQMFQNHMTEDEKWQRPEGKVENLVGKLASTAVYEADGGEGPGLYADVEFYPSYVERIKEIHKDVGLSVRASGLTEEAEMDGRYGPVLVAFLAADSVDVVTRAGAGGKLTSILESGRELAGRPVDKKGNQSMTDLTKEDFDEFRKEFIEAVKSLPAALAESLAPKPEEKVEGKEEEKIEEADKKTEVEIDHAAIVEALRENDLPSKVTASIIADLKEGKTLDEAVTAQVELREAFTHSTEVGTVHNLQESDKPTGLARAVQILG